MVQASVVEEQLRRIGANYRFWNRAELNELPKILFEREVINHVVSGRYEGGFAILVSTDLRVILVDKKPFFLTLEDIRYERITDVEMNHRLLDATIRLGALTKNLSFTGYNPTKMREMTSYIQERVMQSRQSRNGLYQAPPPVAEQVELRGPLPIPEPLPTQLVAPPNQLLESSSSEPPLSASIIPQPSSPIQATNRQSGAIGQVAVMAADEEANPSPYEQLIQAPAKNPYRSPLIFRRRVSRFY
jgi:hypothetical protein